MRKRTGVLSVADSVSRLAISGIFAVACHELPPRSPGRTGSHSERPRLVCTCIWTSSVDTRPRSAVLRLAKSRSVGSARPTHVNGETALLPDGSDRDLASAAPPTLYVSLPATTFAPPDSVQPLVPLSKLPIFL